MADDGAHWAQEQILPWAAAPVVSASAYAAELERLNGSRHDLFVFDIADHTVSLRKKAVRHSAELNQRIVDLRVGLYRSLLERAVAAVRFQGRISLGLGVGDMIGEEPAGVPLFGYQKPEGSPLMLLPDPEFLENAFYAAEDWDVSFRLTDGPKLNQVMFSGSSTGLALDAEAVRTDASERLAFAARFADHPLVRFTIGFAAECDSPETAALLEAKPYFRHVDFHHQLLSRYILSLDGNGATCSRVVRTLRSRSVLLKVNSPHRLFYFSRMTPWRHYVPVRDADDLERLAPELTRPDFPSAAMADAANAFCRESLNTEALLAYTGRVLQGFQRHVLPRMAG